MTDNKSETDNRRLRRDIATAGLDAILKMVFEDNFIHAGPLPSLFRVSSGAFPPLMRLFQSILAPVLFLFQL